MDFINELDIAKLVLLPASLYLIKKSIDLAEKAISRPQLKRTFRFEKIPIEKKVEILNKIGETASANVPDTRLSKTHQTVQLKFLYEQTGIDMPVWHCHKLIAFIADKNISSYDVRLISFLKNTSLYCYEENSFSLNSKRLKNTYIISAVFWLSSIFLLAYAWWTTIQSLLASEAITSVIVFSMAYFIFTIVVTGYTIVQTEGIWQSARFARLFERWFEDEQQVNDTECPELSLTESESQTS